MARHTAMHRVVWFAAILSLALPSTASAATRPSERQATPAPACSAAPSGLLLASPGFTNGQPDPGLKVIDPGTGAILRTFDISAVQYGLPTSLPGHALVETLDGQIYVVDANAGTAVNIKNTSSSSDVLTLNSREFNDTAGRRWTLVSNALLVDLQTGRTIDLKALLSGKSTSPIIASAAVSPDDAHVLIWDGVRLYLAETADPTGTLRTLGGGASYGGSFSPNGKEVAYTDPQPAATPKSGTPSQMINLVVEPVDGSTTKTVGANPYSIHARWIDQSHLGVDQVVDAGTGKISRFSVLDLETSVSVTILPYAVNTGGLVVAREGRWLLHQHEDGDNRIYEWIDLKTGTLTPLPALTNLFPATTNDARWTVFSDPATTQGKGGASYVGFDMETGKTTTQLEQQAGDHYAPITVVSPDGRYAALTVFHGSETQLWLLDNQQGTPRQVKATGSISSFAFSPDGCWIAISSLSGAGNLRAASLILESLNGGRQVTLGQGLAPVWLAES